MDFYKVQLVTETDSMLFNFADYMEMTDFVGTALENGRFNNDGLGAIITIETVKEVGLNE